jgi:PAS domain S-box-containing protein
VGTARPFQGLPLIWTDTNIQSLFNALPDAILMVNQAGRTVVANIKAEKIFGYSHEELIGRPIEWLLDPKLGARHGLDLEQYFRNPKAQSVGTRLELFAQQSDGTAFPAEINLSPIATLADNYVIIAIREATAFHPIKELNKSESVLREIYEGEARFHLAADFAPMMIWMSGTDRLFTYFNEPWLDFTGRSMEQEKRDGWRQGVHPDDLRRCLNTYKQAFDRHEEYKIEYRLRRYDGEYRWIFEQGVPRFNADHTFAGYIGSCVEMTGVNRMEEALRQKELDLIESQRLAGVGSWQWHIGSDALTWSGELYRIAGRDPALRAPTYKEHSRLFTVESWGKLSRAVEEAWRAGTPYELDLEMVRPDGTTRWIRSRGEAQRDNTGCIVRLRGTAQDITDRKKTEKELSGVSGRLLEAQEQERSRIARDLHDDISQRLALLVNDMGGMENDLPDSAAEARSRIHEIGERASEICSDIQDISHQLHSSKLQYLGIAAAAKIFCKEFSEHEKLEIDFHSIDIPPSVPDDISLCLFRVLQEALHNAAKHSRAPHLEVTLRGASGEIQLAIRDSGIGFDPEEVMKRNGLGLISIRERVGLVGGTFSILSKPHSGTEINVRVPIFMGEQASQASG